MEHGTAEDALIRVGSPSPQLDLMRELLRALGNDQEAVCLAYMEAERDGKVPCPGRAEDPTLGTNAKTLWRDGKEVGWLTR